MAICFVLVAGAGLAAARHVVSYPAGRVRVKPEVKSLQDKMDISEIEKIARLCKLSVAPQQTEVMVKQLTEILALVKSLDEAGAEDLEPLASPLGLCQRLRADEVTEENGRELLQTRAPETKDGFYLIPKVIEK